MLPIQIFIVAIVLLAFGLLNLYKDLCSLIEYILQYFQLVASGIWNPSGIFIYMSLYKYPYKYVVMTSMRCKSSPSRLLNKLDS